MSNKNVILLTGGSSGIGLFAVKELVKTSPGATIVVASRTPPPNSFPGVHFRALDLCSDSSVRAFVKSYDCGPISSLVLNAGLFPSKGPTYTAPDTQSRRHETALAASHIGHALLLYLLAADKVLQPRCRLIFVTSALHDPRAPGAPAAPYWTSPEAADSATDKRLASGAVRYANAKLAVVLFANALARKTKESKQWEILIFEPGFSPGGGSKLDRDYPAALRAVLGPIMRAMLPLFALRGTVVSTPKASGACLAAYALRGGDAAHSRLAESSGSAPYFMLYNERKTSELSYQTDEQEELWEWTKQACAGDAETTRWDQTF